jgi:hypothetical protein
MDAERKLERLLIKFHDNTTHFWIRISIVVVFVASGYESLTLGVFAGIPVLFMLAKAHKWNHGFSLTCQGSRGETNAFFSMEAMVKDLGLTEQLKRTKFNQLLWLALVVGCCILLFSTYNEDVGMLGTPTLISLFFLAWGALGMGAEVGKETGIRDGISRWASS